jgi:hypothetical protein
MARRCPRCRRPTRRPVCFRCEPVPIRARGLVGRYCPGCRGPLPGSVRPGGGKMCDGCVLAVRRFVLCWEAMGGSWHRPDTCAAQVAPRLEALAARAKLGEPLFGGRGV